MKKQTNKFSSLFYSVLPHEGLLQHMYGTFC